LLKNDFIMFATKDSLWLKSMCQHHTARAGCADESNTKLRVGCCADRSATLVTSITML